MDFLYSDEPIIACSTGNTSNCAIAVIRLSGFKNINSLQKHLSLNTEKIEPRRAYYCDLLEDGKVVDQVVATFFKAPFSYNGENILELSVHGNVLNVEKILHILQYSGNFRLACPGEFSYRALKNKKLNLSQVEGLDLLLNANSNFALDQGFSLLNGKLQSSYIDLQKSFLDHKSSVELSIDFMEDVGEAESRRQLEDTLSRFKKKLNDLCQRSRNDSSQLVSPEIVLVGQPNSGKSTFFNFLVREERSIVNEKPGTTRDYITENITVSETRYRLVDTAGIRRSQDEIEMEGVKRSLELAKKAFFKTLLINPFEFKLDYLELIKGVKFDLVLLSHFDENNFSKKTSELASNPGFRDFLKDHGSIGAENGGSIGAENGGSIGAENGGSIGAKNGGSIGAKNGGSIGAKFKKETDSIWFAALNTENKELLASFNKIINKKFLSLVDTQPILLYRHKQKLLEAEALVHEYSQLLEIEGDISIISSELNSIGHCISELIGIISPDDVLHNIFDNFCIGK